MTRSFTETLTDAARAAAQASTWERDQESWNLPRASTSENASRLLSGRFEARFAEEGAARAAARDARAVGFVVDVDRPGREWLAVGRRRLPFPADERDRYASRFRSIAAQHGGAFTQFAEETQGEETDGK